MKNQFFVRLSALLLFPGFAAVFAQAEVFYPGDPPGTPSIQVGEGKILLENQVLEAAWLIGQKGIKPQWFRNRQNRQSLPLQGEVFQIVLSDGQRYSASGLVFSGKPLISRLTGDGNSSRQAARKAGWKAELPMQTVDGRLRLLWRLLALEGGNYFRQELELTAVGQDLSLEEILWLSQPVPGAQTAGRVDGSPLVAGDFFFGIEDPMSTNLVDLSDPDPGGNSVPMATCRLKRQTPLRKGEGLTVSFVAGVSPAGQMRRGFLYYLEEERAHPYRPFLHYNSWYDISWDPFALNESNCREAIRLLGENFLKRHAVIMDSIVFDDGWDDPKTLWQFHSGFPRGFTPLADLCKRYGTQLGVWFSPFGGYGAPKIQRLQYGTEAGFETNAAGFSMAGPRYYAAFKQVCLDMIRRYGVNYFKFDGIASGMYADGSGPDYLQDTEAMRRLLLELRREAPKLFINLTTGSWPSPFWLRYADTLWRQGGDMGFSGKGNLQQQWLTYRDQQTYQNIVGKGPLFPLNSLMTQGVAYSRRGDAGRPEFNAAGFRDDVHAFFGSGTSIQELYIQPDKLTPEDWEVLAESARWARARAEVLVDTHWIGGNPAKLEVYGFASWSPRRGTLMLRNPDDQPRLFGLDVAEVFELPPGAPRHYTLASPWSERIPRKLVQTKAGQQLRLDLKPFEVIVWDALPAD